MTEAYYIGLPEAVRKQTPAASVLTLRLRSPSSSLSSLSPLRFVCTSIFESWTFSCPFLSKKSILVKRVHALLASHFCYRAKALLNEVLRFLCSPQEAPKGNTKGLGMAQSGEDLACGPKCVRRGGSSARGSFWSLQDTAEEHQTHTSAYPTQTPGQNRELERLVCAYLIDK